MTFARLLRVCTSIVFAVVMATANAAQRGDRPFDATSLAAIKTAFAGRPFVLAFWSIHCAPCLQDMADWRALRQRYPDVPILLVNTDTQAEGKRVAVTLGRYPPGNVEKWAFADEFTERVRYSVDRAWRGELPRTYFYDADHNVDVVSGRLDRAWTGAWFSRVR
jgi:thiol-disulfide isomerase/thioredoxin